MLSEKENMKTQIREKIGSFDSEEDVRCSGRTLGLKLKCIGDAILARGEKVEFIDHVPHLRQMALHYRHNILELSFKLGLKGIEVELDGSRVFVIATEQNGYRSNYDDRT